MIFLKTDQKGNPCLNVYVQPKASCNQICGVHSGALRVRITAPPVDDKANGMLIRFFSKLFKTSKSKLQITQGKQSRNKKIVVQGIDSSEIEKILRPFLEK